jgi:hypothetical protein
LEKWPLKDKNTIVFFVFIIAWTTIWSCGNRELDIEVEEYKKLQLTVFPNAKNIEENFYKKYLVKSVNYDLEMFYPAGKVISFYDTEMKNKNYKPYPKEYSEDINQYWNTYVDATIKGEPDVTSFTKSWVNHDRTRRATIVLKYYWYEKKKVRILNQKKELKVWFRIQPFYTDPSLKDGDQKN